MVAWECSTNPREASGLDPEAVHVPHLFDDHIEQDTPDGMFDAVEAELVAHGLLHDVPPERDTEYVQPPQTAVEADQ